MASFSVHNATFALELTRRMPAKKNKQIGGKDENSVSFPYNLIFQYDVTRCSNFGGSPSSFIHRSLRLVFYNLLSFSTFHVLKSFYM